MMTSDLPPRPPEGDGAVEDGDKELREDGMTCPEQQNMIARFHYS